MPKIIDHDKKKREIAETAWQIILRSGMKGVTVRNVASEADLSLGSLRHYFPTQNELLDYLIEHAQEKFKERSELILNADLPYKEKALEFFSLMLPLDEISHAIIDIWFSYISHIYHAKNKLKKTPEPANQSCVALLNKLSEEGILKSDLDLCLELNRLLSLIDGMSIHSLLVPGMMSPEEMKRVLKLHLESLYR